MLQASRIYLSEYNRLLQLCTVNNQHYMIKIQEHSIAELVALK